MEVNNNLIDLFFMDMMNYVSISIDVVSISGKGK